MARKTAPKTKPARKSQEQKPTAEAKGVAKQELAPQEAAFATLVDWMSAIPDEHNGMNFADDKREIGGLLGQLINRARKVQAAIAPAK